MPWSFRRSINLGPFRLTFSKSGISYSFGMGGFRTGVNAKGRRYSSVNVPGTGVRYSTTHGGANKSAKKSKPAVDRPSDESR